MTSPMAESKKMVIIGSGRSRLTAACTQPGPLLEPVVIEGIAAGGQLMLTTDVENCPGFPDGILVRSSWRRCASKPPFGASS